MASKKVKQRTFMGDTNASFALLHNWEAWGIFALLYSFKACTHTLVLIISELKVSFLMIRSTFQ